MTSAAAHERRIVLASFAICFTAMLSPLVAGPMMAKTPSSSTSCFANEIAFSGLPPVSFTTSWTRWPATPPFAFRSSTSISRVRASGAPRNDAGPVTARSAPILSGACSAASAWDAARPRTAAANASFFMGSFSGRGGLLRRERHELAALHGDHLERVHAEAVVVGRRHVEDARRTHPALRPLDRVAHLLAVQPLLLDRLR